MLHCAVAGSQPGSHSSTSSGAAGGGGSHLSLRFTPPELPSPPAAPSTGYSTWSVSVARSHASESKMETQRNSRQSTDSTQCSTPQFLRASPLPSLTTHIVRLKGAGPAAGGDHSVISIGSSSIPSAKTFLLRPRLYRGETFSSLLFLLAPFLLPTSSSSFAAAFARLPLLLG